jgi:hypothetical protein
MEIYEQPTEYTVSAVPLEWPASRNFALKVKHLSGDEWIVSRHDEWLTQDGGWTFSLAKRGQFSLEEALEMAREVAPYVTVREWTVTDALEKGMAWR